MRIIKELREGGLGSADCKGLRGGYGSKGRKGCKGKRAGSAMACEPHRAGGLELGKHEEKNTTPGISWLSNMQGKGGMERWTVAEAG